MCKGLVLEFDLFGFIWIIEELVFLVIMFFKVIEDLMYLEILRIDLDWSF